MHIDKFYSSSIDCGAFRNKLAHREMAKWQSACKSVALAKHHVSLEMTRTVKYAN